MTAAHVHVDALTARWRDRVALDAVSLVEQGGLTDDARGCAING